MNSESLKATLENKNFSFDFYNLYVQPDDLDCEKKQC